MNKVVIIILVAASFVLAFAPLFYVMYRMAFGKEIARFALTPTPKGERTLTITKQGYYAIWVQGKLFTRSKHRKFPLRLYDRLGNPIKTRRHLMRVSKTSFTHGSYALSYAKLDVGTYQIQIDGSQANQNNHDYYLIKHTLPEYWLGIYLLILMTGSSVFSKLIHALTKLLQ